MNLAKFDNSTFDHGRPLIVRAGWYVISELIFRSWIPGSAWRRTLLRAFGSKISDSAVIKPRVRVKYPWRLTVGANCWLGESVWIDNLVTVHVGENSVVSQAAYVCTGSHNWSSDAFDLVAKEVIIGSQVWVCARAVIAPGAVIGDGTVVLPGSVAVGTLQPWSVYEGIPAAFKKIRKSGASDSIEETYGPSSLRNKPI